MENTFTVKIDRKDLYVRKYENKKDKGNSNHRIHIKGRLVEVFSKMINK